MLPKHQADNYNIYAEDIVQTHAGFPIAISISVLASRTWMGVPDKPRGGKEMERARVPEIGEGNIKSWARIKIMDLSATCNFTLGLDKVMG